MHEPLRVASILIEGLYAYGTDAWTLGSMRAAGYVTCVCDELRYTPVLSRATHTQSSKPSTRHQGVLSPRQHLLPVHTHTLSES